MTEVCGNCCYYEEYPEDTKGMCEGPDEDTAGEVRPEDKACKSFKGCGNWY